VATGVLAYARWNQTTGQPSPNRFEACTHHQAGSCTCSVVESRPVLDISTSGIIAGRLRVVASPLPFVIVAGGWPSALIALLALNLPVQSAYFPARFHKYIKTSKCEVMLWKTPSTFS